MQKGIIGKKLGMTQQFDENGKVNTAHTTNRVPFTVCMKGIELNNGKLADILLKAFDEVYALADERKYSMRTAAYIIALRRLVKTKKIRGIFP